jgi:hypothetical protein
MIVPSDDRILGHLQTLWVTDSNLAALIERSLGPGGASGVLAPRSVLDEIGRLPDVNVPRTDRVTSLADLQNWALAHGLPAVLKLDGSWGGSDVVFIRAKSELRCAFLMMTLRRGPLRGLKRYLIDRDVEALGFGPKRAMSVQSYAAGRLANVAVACWRGEIIAHIAVEVLETSRQFGVATVVRVVEGDAMVASARSICRKFDLSGLYGFDFVISPQSGATQLIEINGRATQIGHFPLGPGRDLAAALFGVLGGDSRFVRPALVHREIALFPQEWNRSRQSQHLSRAYHDVPIEDPELTRHYGFDVSDGFAAQAAPLPAEVPG